MSGRRGVPAAPRWSDEQLAQLSAVLDRAEEAGQGFDRVLNLPRLAVETGRSVSALSTMLTQMRRARRSTAAGCEG